MAVSQAGNPVPRFQWDTLPFLYITHGLADSTTTWFSTTYGTNTINTSTGANTFVTGSGTDQYLSAVAPAATFDAFFDAIYDNP